MADEHRKPPFNKPSTIPDVYSREALTSKEGDALEIHYRNTLENLGKASGLLGVRFRKSQNKIQDPAKLRRLVELIGKETWFSLDIFWIKDVSLEDTENLPEPDIIAGEIAENLQTAIKQFSEIYESLRGE